jgi:hypothetical protein
MSATTDLRKYLPLVVSVGITLVAVIIFAWLARWRGLPFSIDPRNLLSVMSPLLLVAGFIERSVEVIISPWRDAGAYKLSQALAVLKGIASVSPSDAVLAQIKALSDELVDYRGKTQQYAFVVSVALSVTSASVGVRALWPLLDIKAKNSFEQADPAQQGAFMVVDVILSTMLLAGGADGIHTVVNSFTTFFSTTAQKTEQSVNAGM